MALLGAREAGVGDMVHRQRVGVRGQVPQSRRRARTQWWRPPRSLGSPDGTLAWQGLPATLHLWHVPAP